MNVRNALGGTLIVFVVAMAAVFNAALSWNKALSPSITAPEALLQNFLTSLIVFAICGAAIFLISKFVIHFRH